MNIGKELLNQPAEVVICGAGIAGVATAYYLAVEQGITNVALVDKHAPLSQTTAKSGENYRNWWPNPVMVSLNNRSIDLMEELTHRTDNLFQMKRRGYVYATTRDNPIPFVDSLIARYQALDIGPIRIIDGPSPTYLAAVQNPEFTAPADGTDVLLDQMLIRQAFPHFASTVTAVAHVRRAGDISVQQLGAHLLTEAKARGVRLIQGEVVAIRQDSQGVAGIDVATKGEAMHLSSRCFVDAAGPFASRILRMMDIHLPIHTVFQQKIAMRDPLGMVPRNAPFTIYLDEQTLDWTSDERAFWHDEPGGQRLLDAFPGGLHIRPEGSSGSTWLKLGWAFNHKATDPVWEPPIDEAFPEIMLRGAAKLVPGLRAYQSKMPKPLVHFGGYYVKTPENLPIIGPLMVDGAYMVGALAGYGTMAGCAAGELCAAWIAGGHLPGYAQALTPARYQDPTYAAELDQLNMEGEL